MATKKKARSYYDRTIDTIRAQAEARGIPEDELGAVKKALEKRFGKLVDLSVRDLTRLNQKLEGFFVDYLGGKKRRGDEEPSEREEWTP